MYLLKKKKKDKSRDYLTETYLNENIIDPSNYCKNHNYMFKYVS